MWCLKAMYKPTLIEQASILKAMWRPSLTGHTSIFLQIERFCRYFEQSTFVNNHLLCNWPTLRDSISKICPKFQVLSAHFSEQDYLLDEHWAKIVQSKNISIPIYVQCNDCIALNNMYWYKVCCREFWYIVSGLLEQSKISSPAHKKSVQRCKMWQVIYCCSQCIKHVLSQEE